MVEARELDRRKDLPGLHRRAAHHRELVDQRVDRRDDAVAPPAPLLLGGAARVEPVARPARRAAGGDPPEPRRSRGAASASVPCPSIRRAPWVYGSAEFLGRHHGRARTGRQPRAEQDEHQPGEGPRARALVEHRDAEKRATTGAM